MGNKKELRMAAIITLVSLAAVVLFAWLQVGL
jgi:hypothetical protein